MAEEASSSGGWKSIDRWVGVVGLVIGLLGVAGIFLGKEARETLAVWFHTNVLFIALIPSGLAIGLGILVAIWRTLRLHAEEMRADQATEANKKLHEANAELESDRNAKTAENERLVIENEHLKKERDERIEYVKLKRDGWDEFSKKGVRYGHLEYDPFLRYDDEDKPVGLGVELLQELFAIGEEGSPIAMEADDDNDRNWKTIFEGLQAGEYDVVATPLFATFDRSKNVGFTSPLFFSNVSLYVPKDIAKLPIFKKKNFGLKDLEEAARETGIHFMAVEGEISERLANKYHRDNPIKHYASRTSLFSLFNSIASSVNPHYGLFCESFYAERQSVVRSGEVVRVLPWHQILYPVCFAVKLGDYQLMNLLNVRLLKMAKDHKTIDLLAQKLAAREGRQPGDTDIKKHFVAEWPCPIDQVGITHG